MRVKVKTCYYLNSHKWCFDNIFDSLYDFSKFIEVLNVGFDFEFYIWIYDESSNIEMFLGSYQGIESIKLHEKELPF